MTAAGALFEQIAAEAGDESPLWTAALLPREGWREELVFSPLGAMAFALATESIYEGYLLHYGTPRLFAPADRDTQVLLGDYLFAHGLVRLARLGPVSAVSAMAELIALCTQLRAAGADAARDGAAWAATAALLGVASAELERARTALRLEDDSGPLRQLAGRTAGEASVERALFLHRSSVE